MIKFQNYIFQQKKTLTVLSVAQQPYMSITAHFITKVWKSKSAYLACRFISECQIGNNLVKLMLGILEEWDIPLDKTAACIPDHGMNYLQTTNILKRPHINYFSHLMNASAKLAFVVEEISASIE